MQCIADVLYSTGFRWMSSLAAALVGTLHGVMPTLYRYVFTCTKCMHASNIVFDSHGSVRHAA